MSKPWNKKTNRADVERTLKFIEGKHGDPLLCFIPKCGKPAIGMDECITCENLGMGKSTKILSCGKHRASGLAAMKKHALVKHPANLLRVMAAGLKGEEI